MAGISKDALRKEIAAILKGADLAETSAKTVRQELEEKLGCKLISRKKEIEQLVMQFVEKKENGKDSEDEDDEEEEDEESEEEKKPVKRTAPTKPPAKRTKKDMDDSEASEQSDAESEEEYSPKKSPPKNRKAAAKKKKGSDSDSDEEWVKKKAAPRKAGGKGKGSGYTKTLTLSPELAALVGQESMARHEVVKKMWSIIKERDLYDPKNKQFAICDDALLKVMGVKRFRTFGMMKYLKNHFIV